MVAAVRRALGVKRAGHTGTLDPFATGLLVILVGRATRLARFMAELPKVYTGIMRLGETTDTDDATGRTTSRSSSPTLVSEEALRSGMRAMTGRYRQLPPAYSAKKVAGERAYRRARKGEEFDLSPVEVDVSRFDLVRVTGVDAEFECEVGSGTYVRALARDLGARLGCGAHLRTLRRVAVGPFTVNHALPAEEVSGQTVLGNPIDLVAHLESVEVATAESVRVSHGQPLSATATGAGPVALTSGGELLAVAERTGGSLKPRVVLRP